MRQPRRLLYGILEYTLLEMVIQEVWFEEMEAYVLKRHNTIAQNILTQPILYFCKENMQMPGTWVAKNWWEQ